MSADLETLAVLLGEREAVDRQIAALIGRPATSGNIGEYIAAAIFDIELAPTATQAGFDGHFRSGPLAGKTVNIKAYSGADTLLDFSPHHADFYLVFAGSHSDVAGPRSLRFHIRSVYLFEIEPLQRALEARGIRLGVATSVRRATWDAARIYPPTGSSLLTDEQLRALALFAADAR